MVMSPSINSGVPPVALEKAVRAGRSTLAQALQAIAQNWTIALRRLPDRGTTLGKTDRTKTEAVAKLGYRSSPGSKL
jgi:hypothetical protein